MTQTEQVLRHLERKPITAIQAINKYGITRLAARIYELSLRGFKIESDTVKTRKGKGCTVARYRLVGGAR